MEIIGVKYRVLFGTVSAAGFSAGVFGLPAIAYFVRDYSWLQLAISLSSIMLILPLYW